MKPLVIGTRASKLALAQAEMLARALLAARPGLTIELASMTTAGDREVHKQITDWGYKGLFTKELEDALLDGRIDLAVHSTKDMPSELPHGLSLAGVLPRADTQDAWVSPHHATLAALPPGAVVGTSSTRRAAQLLHIRPDVRIVPFRGNVDTRLRKLADGVAEATFLAAAGLDRLGYGDHIRERIPHSVMLPAAAQGAIGIECRSDDDAMRELVAHISHAPTMTCITAERAYLLALDGSCRTPIGGLAELAGDRLVIRGEVLSLDGRVRHARALEGAATEAAALGRALGDALRRDAGDALLAEGRA